MKITSSQHENIFNLLVEHEPQNNEKKGDRQWPKQVFVISMVDSISARLNVTPSYVGWQPKLNDSYTREQIVISISKFLFIIIGDTLQIFTHFFMPKCV